MDVFTDNWDIIWQPLVRTLEMVLIAGVMALVVGAVLAAMRVSPIPLARAIGALYVYTIRNTPAAGHHDHRSLRRARPRRRTHLLVR